MTKSLSQVNPKARLDVLAFRILERFFKREDAAVWDQIKDPVEAACREYLGPKRRTRRAR